MFSSDDLIQPSLREYNQIPMHYRLLLIEKEGIFISYFFSEEDTTSLYFYNRYYVELVVDNETNDLMDVSAFDGTQRLEKYLEGLLLDDLVADK